MALKNFISNRYPLPPRLPSNYTAAPIRLTDDCSIRLSTKAAEILEGTKPPHNYFTGAGAPLPPLLCRPLKYRASRGASYAIICLEWYPNARRAQSEKKRNDRSLCQGDTPTFISITVARILTIVHSIFSVMAGLFVKMLFMLFSVYNTVMTMSEYEAYWLTDFPLGHTPRNNYGDLSKKVNKQVQGKISNFTVNRDHSYKK